MVGVYSFIFASFIVTIVMLRLQRENYYYLADIFYSYTEWLVSWSLFISFGSVFQTLLALFAGVCVCCFFSVIFLLTFHLWNQCIYTTLLLSAIERSGKGNVATLFDPTWSGPRYTFITHQMLREYLEKKAIYIVILPEIRLELAWLRHVLSKNSP